MEGRRRVRIFHALRYRDFRLLFAGQTVSLIGDAAFLTALGWRTFTLVGAGRFGIVLFCQATALLTTLLIGGALKGGRVIADWPGLKASDLYENRDLKPTTDLRAVLKGLLMDHLRVDERALGDAVFPGSEVVRPMSGLV